VLDSSVVNRSHLLRIGSKEVAPGREEAAGFFWRHVLKGRPARLFEKVEQHLRVRV
jgi:hypothetical protein